MKDLTEEDVLAYLESLEHNDAVDLVLRLADRFDVSTQGVVVSAYGGSPMARKAQRIMEWGPSEFDVIVLQPEDGSSVPLRVAQEVRRIAQVSPRTALFWRRNPPFAVAISVDKGTAEDMAKDLREAGAVVEIRPADLVSVGTVGDARD